MVGAHEWTETLSSRSRPSSKEIRQPINTCNTRQKKGIDMKREVEMKGWGMQREGTWGVGDCCLEVGFFGLGLEVHVWLIMWSVKEKIIQWRLLKPGEVDFTKDHHDRCRDTAMGIYSGGEIGFNSEHSIGQSEFIAKEQGGGQWMENNWGNIRGKGASGSTDLTGFLLKTGQGDQRDSGGRGMQADIEGRGFFLNWLSRILAKTGFYKNVHRWA